MPLISRLTLWSHDELNGWENSVRGAAGKFVTKKFRLLRKHQTISDICFTTIGGHFTAWFTGCVNDKQQVPVLSVCPSFIQDRVSESQPMSRDTPVLRPFNMRRDVASCLCYDVFPRRTSEEREVQDTTSCQVAETKSNSKIAKFCWDVKWFSW